MSTVYPDLYQIFMNSLRCMIGTETYQGFFAKSCKQISQPIMMTSKHSKLTMNSAHKTKLLQNITDP